MSWQPLALFAVAGLFAGGVLSTRKENPVMAVILGVLTLLLIGGGVLWLI